MSDTSTSTSTSDSGLKKDSSKFAKGGQKKIGRGERIKEKLFFAFVLLPLSCWYTMGCVSMGDLDEEVETQSRIVSGQGENFRVRALDTWFNED